MAKISPDILRQQRLWIVTGKGGVGKTTVAASLGLMAAHHGRKTLLVETHGLSHLGNLFATKGESYSPTFVMDHLAILQITAEQAFEEYVLQQIRFRAVYNTVFKNKYVRHFIDAAPGLHELLTIGKIWALVEGKSSHRDFTDFDLVIVDAPATGHGLSLLTVPQVVADAVRIGPLKNKAMEILELLRDPAKTMTWLVTLPEEMPVNEAIEMRQKLEETVQTRVAPTLVNCVWPNLLKEEELKEIFQHDPNDEIAQSYRRRLELSRFYIDKLKTKQGKYGIFELPLVYDRLSPREIAETLAGQLEKQID